MPDPLPPETLAEIEARCETATPGPWAAGCVPADVTGYDPLHLVEDSRGVVVAECDDYPAPQCGADAEFIAAARTDVPTLLAEVRRQAAEIERLRAEREWRPIETAPKDGAWVLGWAERDASPYRISWGWNHDSRLAWCTAFGSFVDGYITHWQPLPVPPISPEARR